MLILKGLIALEAKVTHFIVFNAFQAERMPG